MPLIVIYNLSESDFTPEKIESIEKTITQAVLGVTELGLGKDDISFSFPKDPTVISEGVPITIVVELLFEKPKRTVEVRQRLAEAIAKTFKSLSGNDKRMIEVAVRRFNPEKDGFYAIKP